MPTIRLPANNWIPRPHQRPLWDYLERGGKRAIEIAHRRWGKDDVALHRAAIAAHERPGSYWHMLPEYSQARKAIWAAVNPHTGQRRIDEVFPHDLRASTNEQEMFIRFKTGSTWQVVGSDNYDSLVGSSVAGVVFSEFALSNPSSWGFIAPILAENEGWAIFITTPRGRNHAHSMLDMARTNPNWFAEVSTIADTGAIGMESVEEQRREYHALYGAEAGDALIEQEYYCSFEAAILGAYFGKELARADREGRITHVEAVDQIPVHTVWDIGVGDSTAIWFFQITGPDIRVIDYYEAHGMSAAHYVQVLKERGYAYGVDWIPHDGRVREWTSTGKGGFAKSRMETLVELGRKPQIVPDHHLMDGINAARNTIPRCIFDATRCAEGLEALRQYRAEYDEKAMTFRLTPKHDWSSHASDAFRYLSMAWRELAAVKPKPTTPATGIADATWDQALAMKLPAKMRF